MEEIHVIHEREIEWEKRRRKATPQKNGSIYANGAFDDNNNKIKLQFKQNRIVRMKRTEI